MTLPTRALLILAAVFSAGCERAEPPHEKPVLSDSANLQPIASVQDLMLSMVDPAADFLWESVSTISTNAGVEEKRPRTDEEWNEFRRNAVLLSESANLLLMPGRHVARTGHQAQPQGVAGVLTAEQSEEAIKNDRATFDAFATALREVSKSMIEAADDRNPDAIISVGGTLDEVCEGCHTRFWYPGEKPTRPEGQGGAK